MYESERGRVLHWVYTVLSSGKMSTLHSSFFFFPQLTFTASKSRQTALNQMEQLHPKWQVPLFKGSSFTLFPPEVLTHLLCEAKEKLHIHNRKSFIGQMFVSVTFELIVLALQCCLKHSVCLFYGQICLRKTKKQTVTALALVETWQLSTYILRDFSK